MSKYDFEYEQFHFDFKKMKQYNSDLREWFSIKFIDNQMCYFDPTMGDYTTSAIDINNPIQIELNNAYKKWLISKCLKDKLCQHD